MKLENCPYCGSKADFYTNSCDGRVKVVCLATDSNYHGTEGVIDSWCPMIDADMPWQDSERMAADIWNTRIDRWIPVEEGLPEKETINLALLNSGNIIQVCDADWESPYPKNVPHEFITHWKPITLPTGEMK